MPERVSFAILLHRVASPLGAFRKDYERVIAGVGALVAYEQVDQVLEIDLVLGNAAAHSGHVRRVERRVPGIAAKDAEDTDAFVRGDGRTLAVDGVHSARNY